MKRTSMHIVGDSSKAAEVRDFLKSIGWEIKNDRPYPIEPSRLGKLQALAIIEQEGELVIYYKSKTRLAVRLQKGKVYFCRGGFATPDKYMCGVVSKKTFWEQVQAAHGHTLTIAVYDNLIEPHMTYPGDTSTGPEFDSAIQVMDKKKAQEWIGLSWD
jgi:hypothetical protein